MPAYDEMLDEVMLAQSKGGIAQRQATHRFRGAYPGDPAGRAFELLAALAVGELDEAERMIRRLGGSPYETAAVVWIWTAMDRSNLQAEASAFLDAARRRFPSDQSLQVQCRSASEGLQRRGSARSISTP